MTEKQLVDYPGVRKRFAAIGWDVTESGCWEWRGSRHVRGGYGQLAGPRAVPLKAHRIAYEIFKGPIPDGEMVRHFVCDNPPCVNPDHLRTGSALDNSRDAVAHGRAVHQVMTGEACPASRLTWEAVQAIRESTASGAALAKQYQVSRVSISKIRRGLTWKERGSVRTEAIAA